MMMFLTAFSGALLSGSTAGSMSDLLTHATELLTWCITSMGSLVTFATNSSNTIVLFSFFMVIISFVIGLLIRLVGSLNGR